MSAPITRRQFVVGAGIATCELAAGCGRLPWTAPQPAKVHRIGYLNLNAPSTANAANSDAFRQGLHDLGYIEHQDIIIEWRFGNGEAEGLSSRAAELVRRQVEVIVAATTIEALAAQVATSTTPVVFAQTSDPVRTGLVASLARPEGNLTGLSNIARELSGKRLELLKVTVPGLSRVAVLVNPANPSAMAQLVETLDAAQTLGLWVHVMEVHDADELASAVEAAIREHAGAIATVGDSLVSRLVPQLADLAIQNRLPAIHEGTEFVMSGGLMAYGPNKPALYRRAAYYVDRILKGAKPADLPIEQPMRFDFVVNLKTAQALGLTFPNEIMLQVTEVIQ